MDSAGDEVIDRLTIVGVAAFAYVLTAFFHEGVGHGGACLAVGGHPLAGGAYYFDCETLEAIADRLSSTTARGATVVAVHWRGPTNYPLTGDEAHRILDAHPSLRTRARYLEDAFVLDVWERVCGPGASAGPWAPAVP